jgi:hypothetical protein
MLGVRLLSRLWRMFRVGRDAFAVMFIFLWELSWSCNSTTRCAFA